jgi:hypothetical protein
LLLFGSSGKNKKGSKGRSASLRSLYKGIFWDPIFTTPPIRLGVRFTKSSGPEWRLIILGKPQKIKEILKQELGLFNDPEAQGGRGMKY